MVSKITSLKDLNKLKEKIEKLIDNPENGINSTLKEINTSLEKLLECNSLSCRIYKWLLIKLNILSKFILSVRSYLTSKSWILYTQFIIIVVVPFIALFVLFFTKQIGANSYSIKYIFNTPLSPLFYAFIVSFVIYVILSIIHFTHTPIGQKITSWLQLIIKPMLIGAFLGLILSFSYLVITSFKNNINDIEIDTILVNMIGLYLGCTGLSVAFWGIYGEKIPILDLPSLMESLTRDIENSKKRILWAYPGLSFGSLSLGGIHYTNFKNAIKTKLSLGVHIKKAYILNEEEIYKFYQSYLKRIEKDKKKVKYSEKNVHEAIRDSIILMHEFNSNERIYVSSEFRYQIIIIDDIIYFLNSFGLPIKVNKNEYSSPEPLDTPIIVEVVATRIENKALANYIEKEIEISEKFDVFKGRQTIDSSKKQEMIQLFENYLNLDSDWQKAIDKINPS